MTDLWESFFILLASRDEHLDGRYRVDVGNHPARSRHNHRVFLYNRVWLERSKLNTDRHPRTSCITNIRALHVRIQTDVTGNTRIVLFETDLENIDLENKDNCFAALTGHLTASGDHLNTSEPTIVAVHNRSSSRGVFWISFFVHVLSKFVRRDSSA